MFASVRITIIFHPTVSVEAPQHFGEFFTAPDTEVQRTDRERNHDVVFVVGSHNGLDGVALCGQKISLAGFILIEPETQRIVDGAPTEFIEKQLHVFSFIVSYVVFDGFDGYFLHFSEVISVADATGNVYPPFPGNVEILEGALGYDFVGDHYFLPLERIDGGVAEGNFLYRTEVPVYFNEVAYPE